MFRKHYSEKNKQEIINRSQLCKRYHKQIKTLSF